MKKILPLILLFISFSALSQNEIVIETDVFTELKVFDAITVNLRESFDNKVVIYGDDKDKVSIVNNNGRLKIRMKIGKVYGGKKTYVDVYYSKFLDLIDANEGAFITSESKFIQTYLNLRAQEGGEINLNVQVDKLDCKSVTGGKILVKGKAVTQDVEVNTGGQVDAIELVNEQAKVIVTSGGFAYIHTSEFVEAKVKIGGTIKIYGSPRVIDKTVFIGGNILEM